MRLPWVKVSRDERKHVGLVESGIGLVATGSSAAFGSVDKEATDSDLHAMFENAYKNFPIVAAAIDITTEQVVQEFYFDGPGRKRLELFSDVHNLGVFFYRVCKMLLIHGNCWVECPKKGREIVELKILDPKTMTTFRSLTGEVIGHAQNVGASKVLWGSTGDKGNDAQYSERKKVDDIVHFKFNVIGSGKYGSSIIQPIVPMLKTMESIQSDTRIIVQRYAAPILHAKIGDETNPASSEDITMVKDAMQNIYSDTEFATNYLVDLKVLGFQGKALDLDPILNHVLSQVIAGLQVPPTLMGLATGTDKATAEVQLRSFGRHVKAVQRAIKIEFEDKIIIDQGIGSEKDKLVWGPVEEREKQVDYDLIRGLVKDGIITAQKANSLLPPEFQETLPLPATNAQLPGSQTTSQDGVKSQDQTPYQKGSDAIRQNPTDPTKSSKLLPSGERVVKSNVKVPLKERFGSVRELLDAEAALRGST